MCGVKNVTDERKSCQRDEEDLVYFVSGDVGRRRLIFTSSQVLLTIVGEVQVHDVEYLLKEMNHEEHSENLC